MKRLGFLGTIGEKIAEKKRVIVVVEPKQTIVEVPIMVEPVVEPVVEVEKSILIQQ